MRHTGNATGIAPSTTSTNFKVLLDAIHGYANLTESAYPATCKAAGPESDAHKRARLDARREVQANAGARILRGGPTLMQQVLGYPSPRGVFRSALRFSQLQRALPGVIGVLDGKFVPCEVPFGAKDDYSGAKGDGHTMHVVADADRRIFDLMSGFVATTHDSTLFTSGNLGIRAHVAAERRADLVASFGAGRISEAAYKEGKAKLKDDFDNGEIPFPVHTSVPLYFIGDGAYRLSGYL